MKVRTHYRNENNHCEIFFVYEDYFGIRFKSYEQLVNEGEKPFYLIGYLYSHYWGSTEPIDEICLTKRPTYSKVKAFIQSCKDEITKH